MLFDRFKVAAFGKLGKAMAKMANPRDHESLRFRISPDISNGIEYIAMELEAHLGIFYISWRCDPFDLKANFIDCIH